MLDGGEQKQTPTHRGESARLCMFSEASVGCDGPLGLSRPEETQTGWSHPTYVRQEEEGGGDAARKRNTDGGSGQISTTAYSVFTPRKRAERESERQRQKI